MKKYIKSLFVAIVCIVTIQSCDNYLEETNPNALSADTFFNNLEESNTSLTGVYGAMLNTWIVSAREESWRSDEAFPGIRNGNINLNALNFYEHNIREEDRFVNERWDALYQVIWRANQLIDGLNGMSEDLKSQTRWTEQMGQARFFRGLAHFYLHSVFNEGQIVIRDFIPATQEDFSKPLSTSQEVVDFFREDLMFAYNNLPPTFPQRSRVTAGTAATILGTSYLYTASDNPADYQTAKTFFNDVINNGEYGYALEQNTEIMFTEEADFNSESIFEINYTTNLQVEDGNFDEESFFTRNGRYSAPREGGGGSANQQFTPASWLIREYAKEPLDASDPRNTVTDRVTGMPRLRNVSLRASAMIAMVNDEDTEYYQSLSAPIKVNFSSGRKYAYFKKYTNHDIATSESNTGGVNWKSGKNVILNRLGDVYLMLAECLIQGDSDINGAIDLINQVRGRWGLQLLDPNMSLADGMPYTVESLMNHLMFVERPLELSVEGFSVRNIDLRRWGIGAARFNELSTLEFYVTDYDYVDEDGNMATRSNCFVQDGTSPDSSNSPQVIQEYTGAAQFYTNGYLPIPTSETLNNNQVSN